MESLNEKVISRIRKHRSLIKTKTAEWVNVLNKEYTTKEEKCVLIINRDNQLDYYWTEYNKFLATHKLELNNRSYSEDLYELLNGTDGENCPVNGYSRRIRERISKYEFDENFMKFYLYNEQNKQILCVSMDPEKQCCERFGINFPADMTPFINKTILSINIYQDILSDSYGMSYYKIDITTDGGSFDIMLYNEHNSYYSHRIHIEYDDVIIDECI